MCRHSDRRRRCGLNCTFGGGLMNEVRHSRRVTTELFARFEIGRRPKSIGVENGVVTPWEPREVTYAPKLHVPDPLFPPITTALGSQTLW